jgi:lipopolysaccharide export system permease protein
VKKLTLLVLRSFAGPLVLTFLIALFVLEMQFLWKYIDDLVGKGLDTWIIVQLMVYVSVTLVPLALPLAILLSSIMTFGNLAEQYELTACKAAGVSLQRVMRPLIISAVLICCGAFLFSNYVLPVANLKMNALLYDVRQQKPALMIKEGIFYNGIDGYSIKVGRKDPDGQTLHNLMIYDHSYNRGNTKLVIADRGTMKMSEDERFLLLNLYKGASYEEREDPKHPKSRPLMRTEFDEENLRFDLSSFKLTRTNEQLFKDNYQMLNLKQLSRSADSISRSIDEKEQQFSRHISPILSADVAQLGHSGQAVKAGSSILNTFPEEKRAAIASSALFGARNVKSMADDANQDLQIKSKSLRKHRIEWHRKFTLSFACLILFFIGAPLGAIIRKGGLGMPVVVSILFFVTYHVISISGEKFAREGVIPPWRGMWTSSLILLPIGIFLTYKATTDSALFDKDAYVRFLRKLIPFKKAGSP